MKTKNFLIKLEKSVAIIILNWNGIGDTIICLDSLLNQHYSNCQIFVIDNGSDPTEADELRERYGNKIHLSRLNTNKGFSGGVNYGIEQAKLLNPDYYFLLNNDTFIASDFLSPLISVSRDEKKYGILGPVVMDLINKNKIQFAGGRFNWLLARPYHETDKLLSTLNTTFVTGGAMLIRKDVIEKCGLFDDRFFAYFEDVAFCIKAQRNGFLCACVPTSTLYHKLTGSSDRKGSFYTYLLSRNRILFVNNYLSTNYKIYFLTFNFLKLIFSLLFFSVSGQFTRARAFYKGYLDGISGIGGNPRI